MGAIGRYPVPVVVEDVGTSPSRELFLDVVDRGAREIGAGFKRPDDDWAPVLLMATATQVLSASLAAYAMDESLKDALGYVVLPGLVVQALAHRVALVTSMWILRGQWAEQALRDGTRAADDPHRQEVLQALVVDGQGWQVQQAMIKRRRLRPPELLGWRRYPARGWDDQPPTGRLTDGLLDAVRSVNEREAT